MTNRLQQDLARHLSDSVDRLQKQVEKVEFWASAVMGFTQPVPDYEPAETKIGRYVKPGRRPRKRKHRASTRIKQKDTAGKDAAKPASA
jgi:hypothetical protein